MNFLRTFDQVSFWLGFLTASLLWWLLRIMLPGMRKQWVVIVEGFQETRTQMQLDVETRFFNDTIRYVQNLHLSAPLFALEEILVTPRLLAPPAIVEPEAELIPSDIVMTTIPYMPDWPELGTVFGAPMLTASEALKKGANLAVIGHPGSGKTVALAHLAATIARREPETSHLHDLTPIFVHAADLDLSVYTEETLLTPIIAALDKFLSRKAAEKISEYLGAAFANGSALVLLDGLDEFPAGPLEEITDYLQTVLKAYPDIRVVAAASPDYYNGLTALGLFPVHMAAWDKQQQNAFLKQWAEKWTAHVSVEVWGHAEPHNAEAQAEDEESIFDPVSPVILNQWLAQDTTSFTPEEITLKAWAAYAGDMLGAMTADAYEAYLRRMTVSVSKAVPAMERLATQVVATLAPFPNEDTARDWVRDPGEIDDDFADISYPGTELTEEEKEIFLQEKMATVKQNVVPELIEAGLLVSRTDNRVSFASPSIAGYLAGRAMAHSGISNDVFQQPDWFGKTLSLQHLAYHADVSQFVSSLIFESGPLHKGTFTVARWLRYAPKRGSWRGNVMRKLVELAQNKTLAEGFRARGLTALVTSGDAGVLTLLRRMINAPEPYIRQLAILGLGFLQDTKAVDSLSELLIDRDPRVQRATCLALAAISTKKAIEHIATALLQGDEDLQRAAAEALSYNLADGHELLKEASQVEEFMVRRAAVFGLARINEAWAREILEEFRVKDGQWVVRNAASQVITEMEAGSPYAPIPFPELHETPWLIQYAGQSGVGISPGEPAFEMLFAALEKGTEEQQLAALDYLRVYPGKSFNPRLYQILFGKAGDMRESALVTITHIASTGMELPSPMQFGYG